ncbi:MBL fold metallo-hydrolase [Deinococcus aetherius]|nr:MBL fold metallo-hydrolase [Deinococcus aetherius]
MRVNDDLAVLPLETTLMGGPTTLHLALILDPEQGHTLVDSGVPGQLGATLAALAEVGVGVRDLRRVILTHQDLDHIGSLADVVRASGAEVLAHEVEAPYIEGRLPPAKMPPPEVREAMLASMPPRMRELFERGAEPVPVTRRLHDGERLDLAGGVRVVFTPGHTPGHLSLYLEKSRTLISGDALVARDGQLAGPIERATPDMRAARASVRKLAELDVQTILCYHGGLVTRDAGEQLRRLADQETTT